MSEFIYNNIKNISTNHTLFEFNYKYYHKIFFENEIYYHLRSCFAVKLAKELRKLIKICY